MKVFTISIPMLIWCLSSFSQEALLRKTQNEVIKIALAGNKGNCSNFNTTKKEDGTKLTTWVDYHMRSQFNVYFDKNGLSLFVAITPNTPEILSGWLSAINERMTKIKKDTWSKEKGGVIYNTFLSYNNPEKTTIVFTYQIE